MGHMALVPAIVCDGGVKMEDWKMWAFWTALGFNLVTGAWNLVATIRHNRKAARLDRGAHGAPAHVDDEATRKETAEWLAQAMKKIRGRDQAVLAELRSRAEAVRRESEVAVLREARSQLVEEIAPLLQAIQKKAQDLQGLQPGSADVQGLLEDVCALSEAIGKTP